MRSKRHRFQAQFQKISGGHPECPLCPGSHQFKGIKLSTITDLAAQFHRKKNANLKPEDFTTGMNQRVWWKCPAGADHEWQATVSSRATLHTGCPFCANRRISKTNSLASEKSVARDWHPTKNKPLTPATVLKCGQNLLHWRCHKCECEWQSSALTRVTLKSGCPECSRRKGERSNLSARERQEILKQLDAGSSVRDLANEYGVNVSTISRLAKKHIV